ncbi:MAG: hypothetical protein C4533_01985 [Candidatus Omnitrophota bacterium]|nr:MAG: hypothetical protein C4533_01985 [Candidatus Omnitrophota bacterium]
MVAQKRTLTHHIASGVAQCYTPGFPFKPGVNAEAHTDSPSWCKVQMGEDKNLYPKIIFGFFVAEATHWTIL